MLKIILLCAALLLACGCAGASSQQMDWTNLAAEAVPEFEQGKCGAELHWTKVLKQTQSLEIIGSVKVRRKCQQKP